MKSLPSEIPQPTLDARARFRQVAESHPLWSHPFVERCRAGQLTLSQVRVIGAQMYKFCHQFPSFLALALAACPQEDARIVIGKNLWEELGEGDPQRAHASLFRQFTRALGVDDVHLSAIPAQPETAALIDTYRSLGDDYGVQGILGALCYASEGIVAALYSHIQRGLRQAGTFDREALMFFEVHIHADDEHADKLEAILLPMLSTFEDELLVQQAIRTAMDARCLFFDGVLREAERVADFKLATVD
ncbi:MAG TPA: iron-containing redox enzyme family protein [Ideonella sp.]|uniref:TenA family transcriptional regulator n=1 Tax=Ideonella sp. TaxID=1929293 RepID=UPI002E36ABC2|nr:iron-containing redox enzyme family protein [Ideonella sp.]HEX5684032.1 iron-containing redox enzyme family protein [Ideonella sp.]